VSSEWKSTFGFIQQRCAH